MQCGTCGEDRFENGAQGYCHSYKNHAEFSCSCKKKFMKEEDLKAHQEEKENNAKPCRCSCCCRSFQNKESLFAHQRSKDHWEPGEQERAESMLGRFYCHYGCMRSFKTKPGLDQHRDHFQSKTGMDFTCVDCIRPFPSHYRLDQHRKDTGHKSDPRSKSANYMDKFMKKVNVDPVDKKEAIEELKRTLDPLLKHISQQPGGHIYPPNYKNAGSHAVKAKIGKADEFDTNIPMNVNVKDIKTRGSLPYIFEDKVKENKTGHSPKNLNVPRNLVDNPSGKIPIGRARVSVNDPSVPPDLVYKGDLIPHKILKDFYHKVLKAKDELNLKGVHISRNAHGPAVTLKIKRPNKHDIDVDLTPTLPCKDPVTHNGWPRPDTKKAFHADVINKVIDSGMHLVPKGDEAWSLSYSKAETALLSKMDGGNGCRRETLKYLKRGTEVCASSNGNGLPGISSHIMKHAVLWCAEENPGAEHWHQRNSVQRKIDAMGYAQNALRRGKMPNYFDTKDNILTGKDSNVCKELADHFRDERRKLIHM